MDIILENVKFKHSPILSIGSGSGLFEWLLMNKTGLKVVGLDVAQFINIFLNKQSYIVLKPGQTIPSIKDLSHLKNFITTQNVQNTEEKEWPFKTLLCVYLRRPDILAEYISLYGKEIDQILAIGPIQEDPWIYQESKLHEWGNQVMTRRGESVGLKPYEQLGIFNRKFT